MRGAAGAPARETRRDGVLDARAEEQYEHIDFRLEGTAPVPAPVPEPPPEPEE